MQVFSFGRFEDHGMAAKAGIVQKHSESGQPNTSPPDMFVTVHVRSQASLAVIEVEEF
jgi:hypothetical protein